MTNVTPIRPSAPKCKGCGTPLTSDYRSKVSETHCKECVWWETYRDDHAASLWGTDPDGPEAA